MPIYSNKMDLIPYLNSTGFKHIMKRVGSHARCWWYRFNQTMNKDGFILYREVTHYNHFTAAVFCCCFKLFI